MKMCLILTCIHYNNNKVSFPKRLYRLHTLSVGFNNMFQICLNQASKVSRLTLAIRWLEMGTSNLHDWKIEVKPMTPLADFPRGKKGEMIKLRELLVHGEKIGIWFSHTHTHMHTCTPKTAHQLHSILFYKVLGWAGDYKFDLIDFSSEVSYIHFI